MCGGTSPHQVKGTSMLPAMNLAGDVVAVDRVSAWFGRVDPGDTVLLISPENPRKMVAKRVLWMEGAAVTYLIDPGNSESSKTVVGDNIYDSRDSRQFVPVPYDLIIGKIFFVSVSMGALLIYRRGRDVNPTRPGRCVASPP
ncbi:hypothetical protein ABZP36_029285, partial [Zizania latifolia]